MKNKIYYTVGTSLRVVEFDTPNSHLSELTFLAWYRDLSGGVNVVLRAQTSHLSKQK